MTGFCALGSGASTVDKARKGKKGGGGGGGSGGKSSKLVDVIQLRNKYIVKLLSIIKFTKAAVDESMTKYIAYKVDETELFELHDRYLDVPVPVFFGLG